MYPDFSYLLGVLLEIYYFFAAIERFIGDKHHFIRIVTGYDYVLIFRSGNICDCPGGEKISGMINLKRMFLIIAVLSAIAVAMTHTVTLFSGQHSWYNLAGSGSNVPCLKCHADIGDEMATTGAHVNVACDGCHRTDASVGYASDWEGDIEHGQGGHSASTEECMICHTRIAPTNFTHDYLGDECFDCYNVPFTVPAAGGFDLTGDTDDTGEKAAHLIFVQESLEDPLMEGANEACVQCHTEVSVEVSYYIPQGYKIELNRECGWEVNTSYYNFTYVGGS